MIDAQRPAPKESLSRNARILHRDPLNANDNVIRPQHYAGRRTANWRG